MLNESAFIRLPLPPDKLIDSKMFCRDMPVGAEVRLGQQEEAFLRYLVAVMLLCVGAGCSCELEECWWEWKEQRCYANSDRALLVETVCTGEWEGIFKVKPEEPCKELGAVQFYEFGLYESHLYGPGWHYYSADGVSGDAWAGEESACAVLKSPWYPHRQYSFGCNSVAVAGILWAVGSSESADNVDGPVTLSTCTDGFHQELITVLKTDQERSRQEAEASGVSGKTGVASRISARPDFPL